MLITTESAFIHFDKKKVNTTNKSDLITWYQRFGGKPHHRVKGAGPCVSWCVTSRNERGGGVGGGFGPRTELFAAAFSSFLPAAAPDKQRSHHWSCASVSGCLLSRKSALFSSPRSSFTLLLDISSDDRDFLFSSPALISPPPGVRAETDRRPTPIRSLLPRPGRAGHGGLGEGTGADGQVHASAYLETGRASLRHSGPDGGLYCLLLPPLPLHLRAALVGPAIPTQALQLPDGVPVPVPAVVGPAHRALLLLLQELHHSQHSGAVSLLAALLLPGVPPVLHPQSHEPLLCTGE